MLEELIRLSREENPDWDTINSLIIDLSKQPEPEKIAREALPLASDPDSKVRDTAASIIAELAIAPGDLLSQIISKMSEMVSYDPDIFASGRAATVLLRYAPSSPSLSEFKERALANNWKQELLNNIPNSQLHSLLS